MKKIGITGGVGSGKSEVIDYIAASYNAKVLKADEVAHLLEAKGMDCYNKLVDYFGIGILGPDEEIDKQAFAKVIFSDTSALDKVNSIVHPAVRAYIEEDMLESEKAGYEYYILEAALLIECGYKEILDELWAVATSDHIRRDRLKQSRGYSDSKIDNIMKSQMSIEQYKESCDRVIINDEDIIALKKNVDAMMA